MIGWRKMTAFLGVIALGIVCVITGTDLPDNVAKVVGVAVGGFFTANYLIHRQKAEGQQRDG